MKKLDEYNNTELVAIATANDVPGFYKSGSTRGIPRQVLLGILERLEALDVPEPFADTRAEIEEFVRRRWSRLKDQMSLDQCPNCREGRTIRGEFSRCSDLSVALCFGRNEKFMRK
jgi:hypothetical protein